MMLQRHIRGSTLGDCMVQSFSLRPWHIFGVDLGTALELTLAHFWDLPRPIIGFYGGMDEYRMDVDLMVKIACHVRGGSLLLIGPAQMDLSAVKAEPNVRHIGQLPPEQLGHYAAHFDVGVIPFLANEFNRNCNPTKLKEYLALAFPIVATKLPAFDPYGPLIYQADTHDAFLRSIDQALGETDAALGEQRRSAVKGSSWDVVARRVADMLAVPAAAA